MHAPIGPLPFVLAVLVIGLAGVGGVRWAKRHSTGAQIAASALLLLLGLTMPIIQPPQQRIEEGREDKGKKGSESGGPDNPESKAPTPGSDHSRQFPGPRA
jgi:hypothetical protein